MFLPPDVVERLVHRDSYPELRERARHNADPVILERRPLRSIPSGGLLAMLRFARGIGAVAGRAARLNPARGH